MYVADTTMGGKYEQMIAMYSDPFSDLPPPLIRRGVIDAGALAYKLPALIFDGFKVAENGLIWTSSLEALSIIDPTTRTFVTRVFFGVGIANVTFGDNKDVFIVGGGYAFRMKRNLFKN